MGAFKTFLEWLNTFKEEIYPIEVLKKGYKEPLEEIAIQKLINNTDQARLDRVPDIRTQPPRVEKDYPGNYKLVTFNFKSKHSTTGDRARGYIIVRADGDVKECFCSCCDYYYRLFYLFVKAKLARWNVPTRFRNKKLPLPNRKPPVITNPDNRLYVCKHIAALKNYLTEK